ncbi:hypothetical protein M409DRAFT_27942 [Zasmidium cellare ATCC 36951]|uniref:F-box domain-containing protein n=1 Tax=Zasmidium cellare ATCC 36951 TaxID=1080233 RepID=A0A6A6C358_ZASCE|nr:uncharacterized protein M409DRAFT_27942 [Zasmidium cellare ATCC 36951]KAF2161544.1 hypothetical protein M409DRAFT_27942 [Zasmidium cellare ATCC 36951]
MASPTQSGAQATSEPSSTHPPDASTSTTSEQGNGAGVDVAANKVFDTVELLEMILLGVPMMDLFVLQRTSNTFRDTMRGSKKLKQHMFLEQAPTKTAVENPVMESLYWQPDNFGNSWTLRGIACFKRSLKFHFEEMVLNEKGFYEPSKYAQAKEGGQSQTTGVSATDRHTPLHPFSPSHQEKFSFPSHITSVHSSPGNPIVHSFKMHSAALLSLLTLTLTTRTLADFTIGNCASYTPSNSSALPCSSIKCDYVAVPATVNICNINSTIRTHNDGGVCPGNDGNRSLDFCLAESTGSGCPGSFQMNTRDDCGDVVLANDGALPDDGYFYADLIDTSRNNIAVGRCVYETAPGGEVACSRGNTTRNCETFVKCYTGMYGTKEC